MSLGSAEPQPQSPRATTGEAVRAETPITGESAPSLLDWLIAAAGRDNGNGAQHSPESRLEEFLNTPSPAEALRIWTGSATFVDRDALFAALGRHVALIDELLGEQLDAILHHPAFQRLEAGWRGLQYLVEQADNAPDVKIRALNVSWKELSRDLERALEFDQSQLFRKIYSEEFGTPGGEPYGLLIGDYEIHPRPTAEHPHDDLATLAAISQVAAAAFAPFIAAASPTMFGLDQFTGLERPIDLEKNFAQQEFLKWRAFRQTEDSRFVGLVMPRVLMRLPYQSPSARRDGFSYEEDVCRPDRSGYLWGNAAYAFGSVVVRAFAETGWLAHIRGVQPGVNGGGLVTGLASHSFSTDSSGLIPKSSTDLIVTDDQEKLLNDLGFIPLCTCKDTEFSAFYSNQSVQLAKKYDRQPATVNARLSTMLQYMLCASRFAHYLKVIGRDMIGSFKGPGDCERYLQRWLSEYVVGGDDNSEQIKARYPLNEGRVEVRERPDSPGSYFSTFHLKPHYQLDELVASFRLVTELSPAGRENR